MKNKSGEDMNNEFKTGTGEEVLDLVWKNATDAIFTIGHDGAIRDANPSFTDMLGYDVDDLYGIGFPSFLYEESMEEYGLFLEKLKSGKHFPYLPTKLKDKQGEVLHVLASYCSVNNEDILAVGMYKDFTEQIVIQQKLEESERLYRMLVEHLPDTVVKLHDDKIEYINTSGLHFFGVKQVEEVLGHSLWNFVMGEEKEKVQQACVSIYERKNWETPLELEARFTVRNGNTYDTEITIIPIGSKTKPDLQLVIRDVSDRKKYESQLEYLAFHDPLTGLKNRRLFYHLVSDKLKKAKRQNEKMAILYIDLDDFKEINDCYGHEAGDLLLQSFAKRLQVSVREKDIVSRVGGDEFIVLLQGITDENQVEKITKRIHHAFQKPYRIKGKNIQITSSIGVSVFPEDGTKGRTLIYHADQALYEAKLVKNKYMFYR